jgi:predicted lysophospholipase L1 biosynthesis ABC-type transport system permease subunit
MSRTTDARPPISRRAWIGLVMSDVVLFLLANVTAKNSSHPGALSNAFFVAFVIGLALLIVLVVLATLRSRRRPAR